MYIVYHTDDDNDDDDDYYNNTITNCNSTACSQRPHRCCHIMTNVNFIEYISTGKSLRAQECSPKEVSLPACGDSKETRPNTTHPGPHPNGIWIGSALFIGLKVAEWQACWTQAQKGLGSNRSCIAAE